MPVKDGDGRPLNERVAGALADAIAAGDYAIGSSLPSEAVLCETFDASRFTVREALRKLGELGLVETRRGAGSKVSSRYARPGYSHYFRDLGEMLDYARHTALAVDRVALVQLDDEEAGYVNAPAGSTWFRVAGARWNTVRDEVISAVVVLVHSRFVPLLDDVRTLPGAIYEAIEQRSGEAISEAIQQISAGTLPKSSAKTLGKPIGTVGMKLVRRYCDRSGGTMLASINWHPADRFLYTMRLQRGEWRTGPRP